MANVVLTFGQDNSPKVDPTDDVLYRDIDLDVSMQINDLPTEIEISTSLHGEEGEPGELHVGFLTTYDTSPTIVDRNSYNISYEIVNWNTESFPLSNIAIAPMYLDDYTVAIAYQYENNEKNEPLDDWQINIKATFEPIDSQKKKYSTYSPKQLIDINAVANSLNNIFSWTPGERVLDPTFGANLKKMLFDGITAQNSELIRAEVQTAIAKYEPRIQLEDIYDISTVSDTENNTIALRIVYSVPSLPGQKFTYDYFALKR